MRFLPYASCLSVFVLFACGGAILPIAANDNLDADGGGAEGNDANATTSNGGDGGDGGAATCTSACPHGTWATLASMRAVRSALAVAVGADGRIYAIGGQGNPPSDHDFPGDVASVEAYTPSTNTWTTVASMPTARSWLAAATGADGRIYAFGGSGTMGNPPVLSADSPLATVEAYTPSTNTWATVASMPTARNGLAAVAGADGRIYTFGGWSSVATATVTTASAAVEAYTPSTNTWTTLPSMPTVSGAAVAVDGGDGRIYVIGFEQPYVFDPPSRVATVDAYTPSTNAWENVATTTNVGAHFRAAAVAHGLIYSPGVLITAADASVDDDTVLATVDTYALSASTWASVANMPTARSNLAAVTGADGRIYAIGGAISVTPNGYPIGAGTTEAYTP